MSTTRQGSIRQRIQDGLYLAMEQANQTRDVEGTYGLRIETSVGCSTYRIAHWTGGGPREPRNERFILEVKVNYEPLSVVMAHHMSHGRKENYDGVEEEDLRLLRHNVGVILRNDARSVANAI